jgi:hypothetical protein
VSSELFDPESENRSILFGRAPESSGPDAGKIWRFWIRTWRDRLAQGRDLIIVIDADRTAGATRIGKSTLGLHILQELDPTFQAKTVRKRIAGGAADLARSVIGCRRGNGFLYDEGMWGARSRDAMSPDAKMVGEVLGTLASRGAIVVFCTHSMLSLDTEVKALAAYRLLVRRRGLAEVHVPTIQLDLERPRLLPFRQHEMSPLEWEALSGPVWEEYSAGKNDLQDERIRVKLEEQRVWEARRLGLPTRDPSLDDATAGGSVKGPTRAPRWPCRKCGDPWPSAWDRDRHEVRCKGVAKGASAGFG